MPCTFMCETSTSRNNGLISRSKETLRACLCLLCSFRTQCFDCDTTYLLQAVAPHGAAGQKDHAEEPPDKSRLPRRDYTRSAFVRTRTRSYHSVHAGGDQIDSRAD